MNDDGTISSPVRTVPPLNAEVAKRAVHALANDMRASWPMDMVETLKRQGHVDEGSPLEDAVCNFLRVEAKIKDDQLPEGATWPDYVAVVIREAAKRV